MDSLCCGSYHYGGSSSSSWSPEVNEEEIQRIRNLWTNTSSYSSRSEADEENMDYCPASPTSSYDTSRRRHSNRTSPSARTISRIPSRLMRNGYLFCAFLLLCCINTLLGDGSNLFAEAAIDPTNPCAHEDAYNVGEVTEMADGSSVYTELPANYTHRYFYSNYNVTVFNQPDAHRNLIINLEPCKGVVYLFVRKTRRCFPNPYSCVMPGEVAQPSNCEWTHFMSVIDGTRDGAPTFFELPLTSTKYYISVYAREKSFYTLTMLSDIGAYPRPGHRGELSAMQLAELQVQLTWHTATYFPEGISETRNYHIYSAMLLDSDMRTNSAIFLSKDKVMNTVCGLRNNTDRAFGAPIPASRCYDGKCNATIDGVIVGKRYVFNVIAESNRGFNMSYAGLILRTDWQVVRKAASDNTLQVVGAVTGSVFAVVIILYLWMIQLYGK